MHKKPASLSPAWFAAIIVLVIACVLAIGTTTQGHISGEEFSPTHFQSRTFEFYQIPLLKLQVSPVWRTNTTLPTSVYLASSGLISVPVTPPAKWDLVRLSWRHANNRFNADAALLVDWLTLENTTNVCFWEQWSKDHPAAAKKLWPVVQQLAERELYLFIPDVMVLAQRETDPQKLGPELQTLLTAQQLAMVDELRAAKANVQADELLAEAIAADPTNRQLQSE